jgi:YidC/Oxa1 family membrane protein insertase
MEENKIDPFQIIGFVILMAGLFWWINTLPELETTISENQKNKEIVIDQSDEFKPDTNKDFSNSLNLTGQENDSFLNINSDSVSQNEIIIENEDLILKFNSKGGLLVEAQLKKFTDYKGDPLYMVKDGNQNISLNFSTLNGKSVNTSNYNFNPIINKGSDATTLTMVLSVSENQFINFEYIIPKQGFMMDFSINSTGFRGVIDDKKSITLNWDLKAFRQAKSVEYENRYSQLYYQYDGEDTDYLSSYSDSKEQEDAVSWISYGQHFFNSILVLENPINQVSFESKKLFEEEGKDVLFTKNYISNIPLALKSFELNSKMNLYIGPNDYDILKNQQNNISDSIYFGWGIFGWINRFIYFPLFGFLGKYFSAGIAVILMTVITRLVMSPVTYKTYVSQARMKVIKPEITELNEKYKNDAIKKQQETMKLYNKAGANPLLGCVPALFQLPVFYALFCFFPIAFPLRGKPFLWADDLSSYDVIAELPFTIPFYGDHVSLFPILASIAIFFYTMMSSGAQMQPTQPGMPNMKFIMYLMPVMMLFFFNNYASAFSLYYFISNILTILIMLMTKHFIIDEDKIRLQIQENKKKPTTQNRFQRKMKEMMDKADEQRKLQNRK